MSPRTRTVSVSAVLLVVLLVAAALLPVPYVILGPGPTANTLGSIAGKPLITITGHPTYPTDGHLQLVTIDVTGGPGDPVGLLAALRAWSDPTRAVVPEGEVFPPGQSSSQVVAQNLAQMTGSQQDATVAALRYLGITVPSTVVVAQVVVGTPAAGRLRVGDSILRVDSTAVSSSAQVRAAVSRLRPGSSVTLQVRRAGAVRSVTLTTIPDPQSPTRAFIGVALSDRYAPPFTVRISLPDVGGPSAGLMFTLGVIDKLTADNLTGGKFIAGTGTIDAAGTVGPIGGIQQKLVAARDAGAAVFLVPAGNCAQAVGSVPPGLRLVRVTTLSGAVQSLTALRTGVGGVPACPAG